jgi:predicted nuclease with RNAse H fold
VTKEAGLVGVFFLPVNFDAAPGVVRVRRAAVESRRKARFIPLSYCGLRERSERDRQTTDKIDERKKPA